MNEEPGIPGSGIDRLNAGERACLLLVAEGQSSKQIARQLDVKPNTVDDRIRSACSKLKANNRAHAAQIYVAAISRAKTGAFEDTSILRPQNSGIPDASDPRDKGSSAGEGNGPDDYGRERLHRLVSLRDSGRGKIRPKRNHPFATFFWGINKLSAGRRILIILAIALGFLVAVGTMVNGLATLSRLLDTPRGTASDGGGEGRISMLKERLAAANKVATDLAEAEAAVDLAIAKLGALVTSLPDAQTAAKLSPVVGDAAYGHIQGAVASLFTGRSSLVAFHHEMDRIKDRVGLRNFRITATGDAVKILEPQGRNDDNAAASEARAA
ncbi:helix-turn-helix transcriptional regulator [Sphingopyxis sp.]|uniref:helix-turn-helix transcriptional regulator n=1 Tax=Sphingopyxis sp. TaxID=1908224 RepID=UPI002D7A2B18|nr:helix-turn-helix transcriptional regulator [Sphingopyxis sp.]HET6526846.1 helix-turn-helix transcriptional regulator [Sphingopyxis sp.]